MDWSNNILQILFLYCIPIGILGLIVTIRFLRKIFFGQILLELPYYNKKGEFSVTKPGTYALWQKGELFKRTPVDQFKPKIINKHTREELSLSPSLLRPNVSGIDGTGRVMMFSFKAPTGEYILELVEGSSITKIESIISNTIASFLPKRGSSSLIDLQTYTIQIRETRNPGYILVGIPGFIISMFCIIGGFVGSVIPDAFVMHNRDTTLSSGNIQSSNNTQYYSGISHSTVSDQTIIETTIQEKINSLPEDQQDLVKYALQGIDINTKSQVIDQIIDSLNNNQTGEKSSSIEKKKRLPSEGI